MRYQTSLFRIFLADPGAFVASLKRQFRFWVIVRILLQTALLFAILAGLLYASGDAPILYYVIVGAVVAVASPLYTISKGIREDLGYTQRKPRFSRN